MKKLIALVIVLFLAGCSVKDENKDYDFIINSMGSGAMRWTPFEEAVEGCELIVSAEVTDITLHIIKNDSLPADISAGHAIVTLSVNKVYKGSSSQEIELKRYFVNNKGEYLEKEWLPEYKIGEQYILCLINLYNDEFYEIMGTIGTAAFKIENNKVIKIMYNSYTTPRFTGKEYSVEGIIHEIYLILKNIN